MVVSVGGGRCVGVVELELDEHLLAFTIAQLADIHINVATV